MVDRRRKWRAHNQDISISKSLGRENYIVSGSRGIEYEVDLRKPACDCPDWRKRKPSGGCKHILHVKLETGAITPPPNANTAYGAPGNRSGSNYASNWEALSKRVRKRDDWTCQKCKARGGPYSTLQVDAHHIVPKSKGGKDEMENLITLCRSCHEEEHGHSIPTGENTESPSEDRESATSSSADAPSTISDRSESISTSDSSGSASTSRSSSASSRTSTAASKSASSSTSPSGSLSATSSSSMPESDSDSPRTNSTSSESTVPAVLAYFFGIIGGIVVYVLGSENQFARFHGAQSVLFSGGQMVGYPFVGALSFVSATTDVWLLQLLANLGIGVVLIGMIFMTVLVWPYLMITAYQGKRRKIPLIGGFVEKNLI